MNAVCPACDAPRTAATLAPGALYRCGECGIEYLPASAPLVTIHTAVGGAERKEAGQVEVPPWFHERYRLGQVLGQGAMGMVVQATRVADGTSVAVKFLIRLDDELVRRFAREGRLMREVRHPNVVAVHEVLDLDGYPCLVTEYLPGGTLRARMDRGPIPVGEVAAIMSGALSGLAAIHGRGIVHRDLKPENVLFGAKSDAKIADLGIARAYDAGQTITRTGVVLGTPRYMSPEQAMGEDAGAPADVYAIGCVVYEMLAGRPAFDGNALHELLEAHISKEAAPLESVRPDVPRAVAELVRRTLAKKPGQRPADAAALAKLFAEACAGHAAGGGSRHAMPHQMRGGATAGGAANATLAAGAVATVVGKPQKRAGEVNETARRGAVKSSGAAAAGRPWAMPVAAGLAMVVALMLAGVRGKAVVEPRDRHPTPAPVESPAESEGKASLEKKDGGGNPHPMPSAQLAGSPKPASPKPAASPRASASPKAAAKVRPKLAASPGPAATPGAAATPQPFDHGGARTFTAADGTAMMQVAAGPFVMGIENEPETPVHTVNLSSYYLGRYETTNAQFQSFADGTGFKTFAERNGVGRTWTGQQELLPGVSWRHPRNANDSIAGEATNAPVAQLVWFDALAYCMWAGGRLPTEAEWEKAARGGVDGRIYPWGDEPAQGRAAFALSLEGGIRPVGQYGANGLGFYDLAGNAREWCADWGCTAAYGTHSAVDPEGPPVGLSLLPLKVLRGGAFTAREKLLRCGDREDVMLSNYAEYTTGVRLARTDPPGGSEATAEAPRFNNGANLDEIAQDLVALARRQPRPDGLDAAANDLALAEWLVTAGQRTGEARELAERALEIRAKRMPGHPAHARAAMLVAQIEALKVRTVQDEGPAVALWTTASALVERAFGADHPVRAFCASELSLHQTGGRKAQEGARSAAAAVAALDADPARQPLVLVRALFAQSRAYQASGDTATALKLIERASTIANTMTREMETLKIEMLRGVILSARSDPTGAVAAFDRALDVAKFLGGSTVKTLQDMRAQAAAGKAVSIEQR